MLSSTLGTLEKVTYIWNIALTIMPFMDIHPLPPPASFKIIFGPSPQFDKRYSVFLKKLCEKYVCILWGDIAIKYTFI